MDSTSAGEAMHSSFWRGFQHEKQVTERANRALNTVFDLVGCSELEFIRTNYIHALERIAEKHPECSSEEVSGNRLPISSVIQIQKSAPFNSDLWLPPEAMQVYTPLRIELIGAAIRKRIGLPSCVFWEYPRDLFKADFKSLPGHLQAHHTAISGQLGEIDDHLLDTHGVLLRRQDGKRPTEDQKTAIRAALDEISMAVGDLSGLCRVSGLTISHSNGKRLFKSPQTHAVYRPIYNTISLAVDENRSRNGLDCLAHEMVGHWLDHTGVPLQRWINRIMKQDYSRDLLSTSFLDAYIRKEQSIYPLFLDQMVRYPREYERELPELFTPSEVWGRAVEQLVADRLHRKGFRNPISVKPFEWYLDKPGYWSMREWRGSIRRLVHDGLQARLWMAKRVHGLSESRIRKPPRSYCSIFPWVDEFKLRFFGYHLAERYIPRDILD
jgi:hypothetical protein